MGTLGTQTLVVWVDVEILFQGTFSGFQPFVFRKSQVTLELLAKINHMASRMKAEPGQCQGLLPPGESDECVA